MFFFSECIPGKFGKDCELDCHCATDTTCDFYNGKCEGACEPGWAGPYCQGENQSHGKGVMGELTPTPTLAVRGLESWVGMALTAKVSISQREGF